MTTVSAVVLTRNEEQNVRACIESLAFCDEMLVVDDSSVDQTIKIAQNLGAKVYKRDLNGDFASQRNFGMKKAKSEWVLFIDADERVSEDLKEEIIESINEKNCKRVGFFIKRRDYIWGKFLKYGETGGAKFLRLIRRGKEASLSPHLVPYNLQKEVAKLIVEDAKDASFFLKRVGPYDYFEEDYEQNYRYLLWLYGNEPKEKSDVTYTIYEDTKKVPSNAREVFWIGNIAVTKDL